MPLSVNLEENESAWNQYVSSHPEATNYHQYAWKDVVTKSFGHDAYFLSVRNDSGNICGILPLIHMRSSFFGNFLISVPYFNYGGLLCDDFHGETLLLNHAEKIMRELKAEYVELRHQRAREQPLAAKTHKITMILDLRPDEEAQWGSFSSKLRNQVRKAGKSELKAITGGVELLDDFYEVFSRNMRDLGTPVYGKKFFRNILGTFRDTTRVISVLREGKVIASGIMTWFREMLEVPWASSIREYRHHYPNYLLYWEAIRFAIGIGCRYFDFGRSTYGEGTYRFKKQWETRQVQLYWHYLLKQGDSLPQLNTANPKFRMAIKVWQHLPVAATRIVGPHIVKSIP